MTAVLTVSQEAVNRYLKNTPGASDAEVEQWKARGEIVITEENDGN